MVNAYLWRNPEARVQLGQLEIACLHRNATSCWNSWQTSSPTNTEIYRCDFQQIGERASYICDTDRQTDSRTKPRGSVATRMLKPRKPKLSAAQLFYSAKKPHQLLVKLITVQSSALFAEEQPTCCIMQYATINVEIYGETALKELPS